MFTAILTCLKDVLIQCTGVVGAAVKLYCVTLRGVSSQTHVFILMR